MSLSLAELREQNAASLLRHAPALTWRERLAAPHGVAWLETPHPEAMLARLALEALFGADFPGQSAAEEVHWRRDRWGKPFVEWQGGVREWAAAHGVDSHHLHVSNTNDGAASIVVTACSEALAGVGVDVVHLPRLRRPDKGSDYLRRFVGQFMGEQELSAFRAQSEGEEEEALRLRVAAHFSLMEAASKACGTGLKLGLGMGRTFSLPPKSLGVTRLAPQTEFVFGPEAEKRFDEMGVRQAEGHHATDGEYLLSVVLLWR